MGGERILGIDGGGTKILAGSGRSRRRDHPHGAWQRRQSHGQPRLDARIAVTARRFCRRTRSRRHRRGTPGLWRGRHDLCASAPGRRRPFRLAAANRAQRCRRRPYRRICRRAPEFSCSPARVRWPGPETPRVARIASAAGAKWSATRAAATGSGAWRSMSISQSLDGRGRSIQPLRRRVLFARTRSVRPGERARRLGCRASGCIGQGSRGWPSSSIRKPTRVTEWQFP